jgi:hypothetical protein
MDMEPTDREGRLYLSTYLPYNIYLTSICLDVTYLDMDVDILCTENFKAQKD